MCAQRWLRQERIETGFAMEDRVYGADKARRRPRERATEEGGSDQARDDSSTGSLSVSALSPSATPPVLMRQALPEQHVHDSSSRGWIATGWARPRSERAPHPGVRDAVLAVPGQPDRWSRGAKLFSAVEHRVIPSLVEAHAHQPTLRPTRPDSAEIDQFLALLLADRVPALEQAVDDMVARGLSAESIVLDVLVASARRLGQRWADDCSDFVAVTVAVGRLQHLLHHLSPVLCSEAAPGADGLRVLLAQPQDEAHMFGLSVAAEFFRRDGWDVVGGVAGAVGDPVQRVRAEWFDVVGLSIGSVSRLTWARDCVASMRQHSCNPALVVLVGGPVFSADAARALEIGADLCADAVSAPEQARSLAIERQQNSIRAHGADFSH